MKKWISLLFVCMSLVAMAGDHVQLNARKINLGTLDIPTDDEDGVKRVTLIRSNETPNKVKLRMDFIGVRHVCKRAIYQPAGCFPRFPNDPDCEEICMRWGHQDVELYAKFKINFKKADRLADGETETYHLDMSDKDHVFKADLISEDVNYDIKKSRNILSGTRSFKVSK